MVFVPDADGGWLHLALKRIFAAAVAGRFRVRGWETHQVRKMAHILRPPTEKQTENKHTIFIESVDNESIKTCHPERKELHQKIRILYANCDVTHLSPSRGQHNQMEKDKKRPGQYLHFQLVLTGRLRMSFSTEMVSFLAAFGPPVS